MVAILSQSKPFFVSLDNIFLKTETIICYDSQRSILGALLILLYINDSSQALSNSDAYLYGNNTCIFYRHKDIAESKNVLNNEFVMLCEWFVDRKLSIR